MRIRSVKLRNIRSYRDASIDFPDGKLLLSGDIGSGKSTILLAVEFGLFGVLRGNFSGATLLRNGESEGHVEVTLDLDGRPVTLKRNLKKTKLGISQDTGYIIVDGEKTEATSTELKSKVFELIGYPLENVSKSKNLVFRYTVYTPQEEMKSILLDSTADRLDILRKVFGFDKYRRIVDNSIILNRDLKEKRRELLGMTADLNSKKEQAEKLRQQISEIAAKIDKNKQPLEELAVKLEDKHKELAKSEDMMKKHQELEREIAVLNTRLRYVVKLKGELSTEQSNLGEEIIKLQKETVDIPETDVDKRIMQLQESIKGCDNRLYNLSKEIGEISMASREAQKDGITGLDVCPTCKQTIGEKYKEEFKRKQAAALKELEGKRARITEKEKELKSSKEGYNKELQEAQSKKNALLVAQMKKKNLAEKKSRLARIEADQKKHKEEVSSINNKKLELDKEVKRIEPFTKTYKRIKEETETLRKSHNELMTSDKLLRQDKARSEEHLKHSEEEIKAKEAITKRISSMNTVVSWLDETFKVMVSNMEKAVMSKVYTEFNDLFVRWFKEILEDETITARLDETFTPVITQNGYETDISNLSGGEKTSAALAYRLSLNKVINDMIGSIKTKDILILDEPTDGFSGEQLDRLRDVLDSLDIPQVIIVSHETKIESYVDNVIRITKDDHVSKVNA